MPSAFIARYLGVRGPAFGVSTACTSSAKALVSAARLLRSGLCDAVVAGETGLIVPPRDPQALADALLMLAGDPALAARMGEAARRRAEQVYAVEKVNAQLMQAMGLILEETGRTLTASPLLASALGAASALVLGGSEEQKQALALFSREETLLAC